jgi:serine/threonine protein kinase
LPFFLYELSSLHLLAGQEILGKGQFGSVWKGTMKKKNSLECMVVAIKTVLDQDSHDMEREQSQRRLFINEMKMMTKVGRHLNIVNLLGTITTGNCKLFTSFKVFPTQKVTIFCWKSVWANDLIKWNKMCGRVFPGSSHLYKTSVQFSCTFFQNPSSFCCVSSLIVLIFSLIYAWLGARELMVQAHRR